MPVTSHHPQFAFALDTWRRNRDAAAGQEAIRRGGTRYLPMPNAEDQSPANLARYDRYIERALWYAAPERTKNSLIGSVFRKGPEVEKLPEQIQYMLEDADGAGVSLIQTGKEIIGELLEVGRIGVLVDYPRHDLQNPSQEQVRQLDLRANFATYPAETVINWRVEKVGGRFVLKMVVLKEERIINDDGYDKETDFQYRVLRMEDGAYVQRVYDESAVQIGTDIVPVRSDGSRWPVIPFVILGAENNRTDVDKAPLSHLCNHAIAYWQTSADHRENLFTHGQLTLGVTSDLDHEQFKAANPNGIVVGAASGVFLGATGGFHQASAPESSSLSKALQDLRDEMAELGAQIIQKGGQAQTAEAARIDAAAESSVLSNVVGNASEGIEQCLEWAAMFMGGNLDAVEYRLNTDFFDETLDPQERLAMQQELGMGLIAKSDYRRALRKVDIIDSSRTDADIDDEVAAAPPAITGNSLELGE